MFAQRNRNFEAVHLKKIGKVWWNRKVVSKTPSRYKYFLPQCVVCFQPSKDCSFCYHSQVEQSYTTIPILFCGPIFTQSFLYDRRAVVTQPICFTFARSAALKLKRGRRVSFFWWCQFSVLPKDTWPFLDCFVFVLFQNSKKEKEMSRWRLSNIISILPNFPDFLEINSFKIPISLRKHYLKSCRFLEN